MNGVQATVGDGQFRLMDGLAGSVVLADVVHASLLYDSGTSEPRLHREGQRT